MKSISWRVSVPREEEMEQRCGVSDTLSVSVNDSSMIE